jgi:glycine hydroxymethyltransferase
MTLLHTLEESDTAVFRLVQREAQRQEEGLELIASENFTSRAVMEAMGSPLTNKYAEGYPRKRYYGGCEVVDEVEQLAIDRAKELFGADHANVQPHAGSQANLTAYLAVLQPGEKLMGMSLTHGGHLTHGHKVNHSGQIFQSVQYGVQESTGLIDMDQVREMAQRERPKLVIAGTSAYPRIVDFPAFAEVARGIDAVFLVDMAHFAGLVAGGHYPNPMEHAHIVTSTTHKTLRGPRGGFILCREEFAKAVDKSVFPGGQGGPLEHVIAAKAVGFGEALQPSFKEYGAQVIRNARKLGEVLAQRGYDLVSGGTDTHLILVDLRAKSFSGKDGEEALGRAGIHVNKNTVPGDQRSPFVTSGLRIGSSALTTRGMGEEEMARIADFIARVLEASDDATIETVAAEVRELAESFPLYATAPTA